MKKHILLIPVITALVAILPLPIELYLIVKIIICGFALFLVYKEYTRKLELALLFGILAAIFNPVFTISLGARGIWIIFDLIAAAIFFWYYKKRGL